jgi:hypothetical protein
MRIINDLSIESLRIEAVRLVEENERLRAALEAFVAWHDNGDEDSLSYYEALGQARDALKGGEA